MAYKVDLDVVSVHGTNPKNLIERIVRDRIFSSKYWKEQCFGLNAASMVPRVMALKYVGGTFGAHRHASPFICLVLKLLMIQPPMDIVQAFIQEEKFRYVRLLGVFYLRLVGTSLEIYKCLEKLYSDNRKFKIRHLDGSFKIEYIDNFIDMLFHEDRVFDTTLPRLALREVLIRQKLLPPIRPSLLRSELDDSNASEDEDDLRVKVSSHLGYDRSNQRQDDYSEDEKISFKRMPSSGDNYGDDDNSLGQRRDYFVHGREPISSRPRRYLHPRTSSLLSDDSSSDNEELKLRILCDNNSPSLSPPSRQQPTQHDNESTLTSSSYRHRRYHDAKDDSEDDRPSKRYRLKITHKDDSDDEDSEMDDLSCPSQDGKDHVRIMTLEEQNELRAQIGLEPLKHKN